MRSHGSHLLLGSSAVALALLFSGVAPAVARVNVGSSLLNKAPQKTPTSVVPPVPVGFTVVASKRASNFYDAEANAESIADPIAIDVRATGKVSDLSVVATCEAGSGTPAAQVFTGSVKEYHRAGLYSYPLHAGVDNCGVDAKASSSGSGTITVQILAKTGTPTPTPTTGTTTPNAVSPYCVRSNDGSASGWNYYKYVDTTSAAPCYGHWTITLGPGCQFDDGDGHGWYSSGPANVWNIVRWGYGPGGTVALLNDRRILEWSCTINAASYPQTSLNPTDWR